MRYRPLGNTGLLVSEVALGTVELGVNYGFRGSAHYECPSRETAHAIMRRAVELGVNLFDTARNYGDAEERIGEVLGELHPRPYITTKFHDPNDVRGSVENSLRMLRVEKIDLLQIHNATAEMMADEKLLRELDDLQHEGKVGFYGASVYGEAAALRVLEKIGMRTIQVPFNFLDQKMTQRVFPLAQGRRVGVLVRSAFLRGVLTERVGEVPEPLWPLRDQALAACDALQLPVSRLAETALRYCLSDEAVSTVLCGVRTLAELEANVAAAELGPLDTRTIEQLLQFHVSDERMVTPSEWTGLT